MPVTPKVSRASRTSSHLCGLITAVTSFMHWLLPRPERSWSPARWRTRRRWCGCRTPTRRGHEVDALDLVLLREAETDRVLDRQADDQGDHAREGDRHEGTQRLVSQGA